MDNSVAGRFPMFVSPEPNSGCWLWTGSSNSRGYGQIASGRGFPVLAHRISFLLHRGPIPAGMQVLHRCDVRACVNPAHLFLGTAQDNMDDKIAKGRERILRGTECGTAKLTEYDVAWMRSLRDAGSTYRDLGRSFGVHPVTAMRAVTGEQWAHVATPDCYHRARMARKRKARASLLTEGE